MKFTKPDRLRKGDAIAVASHSWGGPSLFPHIYTRGIQNLEDFFSVKIKEYPTARMGADHLYKDPQGRARDINEAFADDEVRAIVASIGGDDSVRILPYLDIDTIKKNKKICLGYSDSTTILAYLNSLGLVTFHGPLITAGFSQMDKFPVEFRTHIERMLFNPTATYMYKPYQQWSEGDPAWSKPENVGLINDAHANEDGWHWLQGTDRVSGELFGGCVEVLEVMKSTDFWPNAEFWRGKILFFETSSDYGAFPKQFKFDLRNYGMQGIFDKIAGLIIGRPRDYTPEQKDQLDKFTVEVVGTEFGRKDLPIISNMDFGHTDPQFILPLGIKAEIDCNNKVFSLLEAPVM